ncbi:MAG: CBS domain-containing protein, partial [Anaerolineae bacterium]
NPDELQQLVAHSINVGALDVQYAAPIEAALQLQIITLRDIVAPDGVPVAVPQDATVEQVRAASRRSGHRRILVGGQGAFAAVVHVRDTMASDPLDPAAPFQRPVFRLPVDMTLHGALAEMRRTRQHLAVVMDGETAIGLVTLADVLVRLAPSALEQAWAGGPRGGRQGAG